jgi:PAS domain S-box-containing protein
MLDFHFNNPEGFLIAFIPALINLGIVGYIVTRLPGNKLTTVFALLTLALALWQINDALTRISLTAIQTDRWDIMLCAAWIGVGPLCLHFALLYTGLLKSSPSRIIMLSMYVPAFIFMFLYQGQLYPHEFIFHSFWGWVNYHDNHWIDIVQIYWISALVVTATIILFRHAFRIKSDDLLHKQTLLIAIGIGIPTATGLIGQVILPIILSQPALPFASTFMTFFSLATVISFNRYRLFNADDMISNERLIDELPVMVFMISEKGRIMYLNTMAQKHLVVPQDTGVVLDAYWILQFESPEDQSIFFDAFKLALNRQSHSFECRLITQVGISDFDVTCKPVINNDQVLGVQFVARDITALKESGAKIAHSENLLADTQSIARTGSWEWDVASNEVTWSDELYRIFGYIPGETKISIETFFRHVHEDDLERVRSIVNNALETGDGFSYFTRINRKDHSLVVLHAKGRVIRNSKNQKVRLVGSAQDVTEQQRKEKMLEHQNQELVKINHELDKFVYSVSHDLRAPLLSMLGVVNITAESSSCELTKRHMHMLDSSIHRLDNFIKDILDYARNSRGELKIHAIDFKTLMDEINEDLGFLAQENNITCIEHEIKSEGIFYSDKNRLRIALGNLLSNAIRYHNPSEASPFVKVMVQVDENKAIIQVMDNGIGISEENQEKIFDMFYRVADNSVGSGLGLYITKEAINKINGNIQVQSLPGMGTNMTICIPSLMFQ